MRSLFTAEGPVEIRADADVVGIARELADVVEVVDHHGKITVHPPRCRRAADPARHHHPRIEGATDHGAAADQCLDHLVGELPVVVDEGAAVIVAGPDRPGEEVERLPEGCVAEVRGVEDHPQSIHFGDQFPSGGIERRRGIGAVGVAARAVMGRSHGPQPGAVRPLQMSDRDHRIGALERKDVADRQPRDVATAGGRREPSRDVGVESGAIDDLHHLSRLLHGAIPVELGLGLRPGLLGRVPAGERIVGGYGAGNLRRDDQADPATPEIRKRDDGVATVGLVAEAAGPLTRVDLRGGDSQVAIPLHRVHRQIEVGVNREHGR